MGCLFSCLRKQEPEETVDDIGSENNSYPFVHSHTSLFRQLGSNHLAPYSSSNNTAENSASVPVFSAYGTFESTNSNLTHAQESESSNEDVCPTCFEEYTDENPKIIAKCSHHYHLGCIYDWKERSDTCPACSKVMIFDEVAFDT